MESKNLIGIRTLLLLLIVSSALFVSSCKKSDSSTPVVVDRAALTKTLASADSLSTAAATTDYDQADITAYKATLATAKTASTASTLTQAQVNSLVIQIKAAMALLNSKAFGFIDETLYLVAGWKFDEGTGTTATSYSTAKQVGTFMKGFTTLLGANAALPTWVDGVKGGKAIHLNNGAHLEVPYSPSFLPASISISAWIKMDKTNWENNIIVSQNYWKGYKFQTQDHSYPMFTEGLTPTTASDQDAGEAVVKDVWTQIAVSLTSKGDSMQLFINGVLVKTVISGTSGIGPLTQNLAFVDVAAGYTYTAQPFLIGSLATDAELAAKPLNFNWITTANVASFEGSIDNLKIFNTALKPGQIKKLYNDEKP